MIKIFIAYLLIGVIRNLIRIIHYLLEGCSYVIKDPYFMGHCFVNAIIWPMEIVWYIERITKK